MANHATSPGTARPEAIATVSPFPAIAPGHHLAPVAIGAPGSEQKIVFVPCPDWCATNHVSNWVHFLEDVDHTGDEFAVHVPSFFNEGKPVYSLTAAVGSDSMSTDPRMRAAHVIVGDEGSVDAYLTPDMARTTANDLRKLADKLDEAARTARLHNQHVEAVA
ncbi:hypothetical protein F7R91_14570 [Streptomyces luteolifulvus]|uniref:Uncharacterized protein n=1 Tax=Streptomyces luteolifulvus TaxID=2615112 RepID=A0A6H9V2X1_9ACTN|nr:hypothetical protein [Streptomyces luteolifulvus]KAB1146800.1 hypothetical protein F7R91_14570 [Streptomyces luteolifulvus]